MCSKCVRCSSRCGFLGAGDQPDTEAGVCCFVPAMEVPIMDVSAAAVHSQGADVLCWGTLGFPVPRAVSIFGP